MHVSGLNQLAEAVRDTHVMQIRDADASPDRAIPIPNRSSHPCENPCIAASCAQSYPHSMPPGPNRGREQAFGRISLHFWHARQALCINLERRSATFLKANSLSPPRFLYCLRAILRDRASCTNVNGHRSVILARLMVSCSSPRSAFQPPHSCFVGISPL
jgi:hypothetical protein